MATVSLQTVFDSAHRALETGAADKATGIAQHILAHFPRMIEGHRLLGEAYLNANEPEQAVAAFEQVLQADPENVAAYYGLGLAQQSLDQRPAAIAAFERALEIQPNLADLRTQLMRLYSETPGSAGQFRLSRAGLGRLYARGGMFGQAIDEFRAVLDADADRDDVTVALAEALWRDGQEDEATDFCRDVLDRRPDLLKPTVLLGYMLFAGGQPEGEALWRRAAEQDAAMTTARGLFDILPPIRLEEPVLPEFDEAEWRAQEAQRVAQQPLPTVAAVANDDDFFADSWLSSAGSASTPSNNARIYETAPTPAPAFAPQMGGDDDDLLASLLGFADAPPAAAVPAPHPVEPFGLDDWGTDTTAASSPLAEALPPTLDDISLPDPTPSAETGNVKPFSFDDWSFEDDMPADSPAAQPAAQRPSNDFDLGGVEAFSFEDDSNFDTTKPFSFEAESDAPKGVQPFSLDDDLDGLGDVEPFALDTPAPQASNRAEQADAGLGAVQPFSLDEWGLDDDAPKLGSLDAKAGSDDDLGDFKPFSLDELSLESLDDDPASSLAGPQFGAEPETTEDAAGFSWEEPSWRTQRTTSQATDAQEGESIFAKLMRNRPQEAPDAPSTSEPEPALDESDSTFFSMDEEPLRLDLDSDQAAVPTLDQLDPQEQIRPGTFSDPAGLSFEPFASTSDDSATGDTPAFGTPAHLPADSSDEIDQLFSWEQPEAVASVAPVTPGPQQEPEPFSLSDLGFSEDELTALDVQSGPVADSSSSPEAVDMTPFSLADLGLSDEELAALDLQDDQAGTADAATLPAVEPVSSVADADEVDLTPFSLADLGLTDDELSAVGMQELELAPAGLTVDTEASAAATSADVTPAADDVDLTPFSLGDLGLNEDELALLNQQVAEAEASFDDGPDLYNGANEVSPAPVTADVDLAPAPPASAFEDSDWLGLSDETELSIDHSFEPSQLTDQGDVAELTALNAQDLAAPTSDEPAPFSLADLGLSDDELALFEQIQSEHSADDASGSNPLETPAAEVEATPAPAPTFDWPFVEADNSQSAAEVTSPAMDIDTPAAAFDWEQGGGFAELESTGAAAPAFEWPFEDVRDTASTATPAAELPAVPAVAETSQPEPTFAWPFDEADAVLPPTQVDTTLPFANADQIEQRTEDMVDVDPVLAASLIGDESAGALAPAAEVGGPADEQLLPMELPEGAQAVEAAAMALPVAAAVPVARPVSAGIVTDPGLAAVHAQLGADPENHAMRLAVARMSQQTNNLDQAVEQYKQLIKRGELLDEVVEDLQDVIVETDEPQMLRRLHRLLGDAYMKQNRFREAMDEYSWTLARRS